MNQDDGTFSKLMEIAEAGPSPAVAPKATTPAEPKPIVAKTPVPEPVEDINATPYISQNYRFTDDELRWLRKRSFDLSEQVGAKVSQNTILRIALRELRDACDRNPNTNPLSKAVGRLKK
jgi:hypothetical protein